MDFAAKYQGLKNRPAARRTTSKIHIVSVPVYYHNYQMGQLFASQVHRAIAKTLYPDLDPKHVLYDGNGKVGEFMKARVFDPGRSLSWNELTKFATGEELNARGFALDFQSK